MWKILWLCGCLVTGILSFKPCAELKTKYGSVCVCNSTYCDTVPEWTPVDGQYSIVTTSQNKLGFYLRNNTFLPPDPTANSKLLISIDVDRQYQTIIGWGGAFTDSVCYNIGLLPKASQANLMESYFGPSGIQYTLGRVVIGGSDFSSRPYSYDDHPGDVTLSKFKLQNEDINCKIPCILEAKRLSGDRVLNLLGTAWTAPPWMKTDRSWTGVGVLKKEFYQIWADYFILFFTEYRKYGIDFWGMTTGNEPMDGFIPRNVSTLNAMGWTPNEMNQWVGYNLGPTLKTSEFLHVKIILHDDNRATLPLLTLQLEDPLTVSFADGVGIHWYGDSFFPDYYLDYTISSLKDLFLLATEACNGFMYGAKLEPSVALGSWERGVKYIKSIFVDCSYRAGGWIDWNMVLNEEGGPTYINNFVDAPIIINNKTGVFYKQPMFYALGHFSKFVVPDSIKLKTRLGGDTTNVSAMAFLRPDNVVALVVYNERNTSATFHVTVKDHHLEDTIEGNSLNTVLIPL